MLRKGASWHSIRVALVLGLAAPMLASMEYSISQLAAGLDQELYYSARLEETSKLDMEATRLFDAAELYVEFGGADLLKAVNTKLDLVWSRVETAKTKSYQTVLEEDKQALSLIPELYDALPSFDAAVKDLRPGDRSSLNALDGLKRRFGPRLNRLSELAWGSRVKRVSMLVEHNLATVTLVRSIQTGFAAMSALGLFLLLFELWSTRRMNCRLNDLVAEKRHLLSTDMLTGICNRAAFEAQLSQLYVDPERNFSAVYIDLDGFKKVNDTFGHAAGDDLLRDVGGILGALAGAQDMVARFGGDEFAALIVGGRVRAEAFVEGLMSRVRALKPANQAIFTVSVSAGVCHSTEATLAESFGAMMRNADVALYSAKQAGRDRIHCFSRDMLAAHELLAKLEQMLPVAIAEGALQAAFQPIVNVETGRAFCAEALVRWNAPGIGPVPADRIIEIAERAGRIGDLTTLMLRGAVEMRRNLQSAGHKIDISVNLSPTLLAKEGLALELSRFLAQNGVAPGGIYFELTETSQIAESPAAEANIRDLQLSGIPIAVDDFGKAYSNMHRLMKINFRLLKLDKQIIDSITSSPRALQILSGLNSLAEAVGAETVAEGVETAEQLNVLTQAGIRNAQGYHFSGPLLRNDFLAYLSGHASAGSNVVSLGTRLNQAH